MLSLSDMANVLRVTGRHGQDVSVDFDSFAVRFMQARAQSVQVVSAI